MQANLLTLNEILNRKERFLLKPYKSGIFLFGEFKILDGSGRNIISRFAPKMQEILAYLIIHTRPYKSGISAEKLSQLFWEGLEKKEAKNNRGAMLSKLRKTLEALEGIGIISDGIGWKIEYDKEKIYCDYYELLDLSEEYFNASSVEESKPFAVNILDILRRGIILQEYNFQWLDEIKADFGDNILNSAAVFFKTKMSEEDLQLSLLLADSILVWEPLNEIYFKIKLWTLNKLGRYGEAKEAYELFAFEYNKTFGNPYGVSLQAMLS